MKKAIFFLLFALIFLSFSDKKQTWLALGDSITYLNDHPDETGNRITKGYMTMVTEKIRNLQYINKGFNGWTAVRVATEIEKLGLQKADFYTVFLGTNDWWQGKPTGTLNDYRNNSGNDTFNGAYRTILNKLRHLNPSAKIVLITPMQRGDFVYINNPKNNAWGSYKEKAGQTLERFVLAVDSIGHVENLEVIDLYHDSGMNLQNMVRFKRLKDRTGQYRDFRYPDYVGVSFNPETDEYPYPTSAIDMTYDGLHPSDAGYRIIARMILKALKHK